jgi:hypothetical protein
MTQDCLTDVEHTVLALLCQPIPRIEAGEPHLIDVTTASLRSSGGIKQALAVAPRYDAEIKSPGHRGAIRGQQHFDRRIRSATVGVEVQRDRQVRSRSRARVALSISLVQALRMGLGGCDRFDREADPLTIGQRRSPNRHKNTVFKGCIDFQSHGLPRRQITFLGNL